MSSEGWDTHFADAFKYDTLTQMVMDERAPKLSAPSGDGRATIVIPKPDKVVRLGEDGTEDLGVVFD